MSGGEENCADREGTDGTGPVLALTDEELLVLTDGTGPVVLPYATTVGAGVLAVATETARRSLLARHVLTEQAGRAVAGAPVGALLELRAGAPVVVVLHRLVGTPADQAGACGEGAAAEGGAGAARPLSRYLHVVDEVVLTEDVTSDGVHTFGLGRRDRLAHFLEEFLVPSDAPAAPPDGARPVTPSAADPLPAALGEPTVLAEATVLHAAADGGPDVLTATLGPGGCFLGRSAEDEPPVLLPVGAGDVVHGVLGEIRAACEAVSRAVGDRS